jgi:hypothetical protein
MVWGAFNIGTQEIVLLLNIAVLAGVIAYFMSRRSGRKEE